jgi:hypothetical protein
MDDLCEVGLSHFLLLFCQERLDGMTSDQLTAKQEAFDAHRDRSRFFKRTSTSYPTAVDANGDRPLCASKTPKSGFIEWNRRCKILMLSQFPMK